MDLWIFLPMTLFTLRTLRNDIIVIFMFDTVYSIIVLFVNHDIIFAFKDIIDIFVKLLKKT